MLPLVESEPNQDVVFRALRVPPALGKLILPLSDAALGRFTHTVGRIGRRIHGGGGLDTAGRIDADVDGDVALPTTAKRFKRIVWRDDALGERRVRTALRACQGISDAFGPSRRPPGEARRPRIPGVFEEGATTPDGMDRRTECVSYSLTGP